MNVCPKFNRKPFQEGLTDQPAVQYCHPIAMLPMWLKMLITDISRYRVVRADIVGKTDEVHCW